MELYQIIDRPVVTERATQMRANANQYVFRVSPDATKPEIRHAVESLFKVKVESVRTMIVRGKQRQLRGRPGRRPDWKKAIITLPKGQEIKMTEEGAA